MRSIIGTHDYFDALKRTVLIPRGIVGTGYHPTVRTYAADRVWEDSKLLYSYFPGGYFDAGGAVHYLHNDYQGSVVLVTDSAGTVEQRNTYYPYGEPHRTPAGQPILYGGKERMAVTGEYNYDARRLFAPMLLMTTVDPLAGGTPQFSPYVFCAANPVKYIDMTGCKFTESSKQFVNKYLTEVSDRMYESLEEIKNLMHLMAFGKLSDKNMNKAQNALTKAAQKLSTYQGIMKELFQLQKSDQVYDISISREYSDARDLRNDHAIAYDRDGAKYNSENGIFEIKLHKNDLGDIAHELKHAYQFENGQISYYDTSMDRTSVTFYDLTDEEEAFQRGALFGQRIDAPVRNIYPNLPTDKRELSPEQKKYLYILQPFSNKKNIIFRWGGKTYRPQN